MDDEQIIELYWNREETAISATEEKYGSYCFKIANGILGDIEDSEECVNDTWLRAWNAIPPQRPNVLSLFLAKITRNLSFDRYRMRASVKRGKGITPVLLDELSECVGESENTEDKVILAELKESINTFLKKQPKRERYIFLRRYFFAETTAEIAEKSGLKESHVLVLLSRTRKKLRKHLEQGGYMS